MFYFLHTEYVSITTEDTVLLRIFVVWKRNDNEK